MCRSFVLSLALVAVVACSALADDVADDTKALVTGKQAGEDFIIHTLKGNYEERALAYLKEAKKRMKTLMKLLRTQGEEFDDMKQFEYTWPASNDIIAAVELAGQNEHILYKAAQLALSFQVLEDPVLFLSSALKWVETVCRANPSHVQEFSRKLQKLINKKDISGGKKAKASMKATLSVLEALGTEAKSTGMTRSSKLVANPLPVKAASPLIPNPIPTESITCDDGSDTCDYKDEAFLEKIRTSIQGNLRTLKLWGNRIAVFRHALGADVDSKLSEVAINRYNKFTADSLKKAPRSSQGEINNDFFEFQEKLESETRTKRAHKKWPELYRDSEEFRQLYKQAKNACINFILQTGKTNQQRDELEKLKLILWTAVYLNGTYHYAHTHPQALCSGVYYSKTSETDQTPIAFLDPRGANPMTLPQELKEDYMADAPFHHEFVFFPKPGDMVLFPSYLAHRVPKHPSSDARVAWPFNLEGDVDAWARTNV